MQQFPGSHGAGAQMLAAQFQQQGAMQQQAWMQQGYPQGYAGMQGGQGYAGGQLGVPTVAYPQEQSSNLMAGSNAYSNGCARMHVCRASRANA